MKGFDFVETVSGGADIKFADDNRVIEVGQAMYAQAASSLLEAVGDGYYYNGSIDVDGDGFYSTPGMGLQEVRMAYVINQQDLKRATELLALALRQYPGRTNG